ncbi:hypothetical protein M0R88_05030 [Halorussus gelatinilyticus]|uniref:Uncharacterized protein n=1 Tax=Halorussus gelatinilyticus TaxID=2937524 RepID=A0A8U0IN77_9EURY|nr:hypothetical protein [Halorussus gelatinilyticus]UPW01469.1 hypothetical protein M0R88_05030 [Halorussus gelatinilyticus]
MAVPVVALIGTFLLAVLFYGVTAHIAARYVLGDVPILRAFVVGLVPALISFALQAYGPLVVILVSATADFFAIRGVYRLRLRTAGLVTLVHYTVSAIAGITVLNIVRLLSTAPT